MSGSRPIFSPHRNPSPEGEGLIRFEGYAALFDRVDRAGDVFRRGAFAAGELPLLTQHRGAAIGRVFVAEDARGLRVTGQADTAVRVGDGLSIGYRPRVVRQGAWRELLGVELVEVSLVAQPMQPGARVTRVSSGAEAQTVVIPAKAGTQLPPIVPG